MPLSSVDNAQLPVWYSGWLRPGWMVGLFIALGAGAIAGGGALWYTSEQLVECRVEYGDPPAECGTYCQQTITINAGDCRGSLLQVPKIVAELHNNPSATFGSAKVIKGPVYVYYELHGFSQASPTFLGSRVSAQLHGEVITDRARLQACEPAVSSANNYLILVPCGIAAKAVFNDTFQPIKNQGLFPFNETLSIEPYNMREDVNDIVWPNDKRFLFKNPSGSGTELLDEWLDEEIFPGKMENAHFQVWMRDSTFPNFRKLYGVIDEDVELPLRVVTYNRYPVQKYGGSKLLVLAQSNWQGGRSPYLGFMYCLTGTIVVLVAVGPVVSYMINRQCIHRRRRRSAPSDAGAVSS